jgi:hypothetical protein
MLERVTLHQSRFTIPGVSLDSRGVLLGREGALLVSSIDRVILFFRLFGAENDLNDILEKLRIVRVTTPLRTQEFIVLFPVSNSYSMDNASKIAKLVDGHLFTGSTKHYVAYRDSAAPLGYDVRELLRGEADFALYSPSFEQVYTRVSDIDFGALLHRLSLERIHKREDFDVGDTLFISCPYGLSGAMQGYLVRNAIASKISIVERAAKSAFAEAAAPIYLFEVQDLPARMKRLFSKIPGVLIFYPVLPNVLIQTGYRHPIRLEACSKLFPENQYFFFEGEHDRVEVTKEAPHFVPAKQRTQLQYNLKAKGEPQPLTTPPPPGGKLSLSVNLVHSERGVEKVMATLIPWDMFEPLRALVYALPPELFQDYKIFAGERYLIVLNQQRGKDGTPKGIERLPLGTMMWETAPSIFLPVGTYLLPRVAPDALREAIEAQPGHLYFFMTGEDAPFAIKEEHFEVLGRTVLARIQSHYIEGVLGREPERASAHLHNESVGVFSLWGHRPSPGSEPSGQ